MTSEERLPAEIDVDESPSPKGLLERAGERLKISPQILEGAEKLGQDILAVSTSRGAKIIIGAGLLVTAATIGAIVLHQSRHKKEE